MIGSIFPGRSTIEYFIAIATVALVFAAGLDVRSYKKYMKCPIRSHIIIINST
jgi:hypothetical protein